MGRGLGAILPETTSGPDMRELPIELVEPNPGQPRSRFDEDALQALYESIKASGVVQPLIVRSLSDGSYEIIAGERRWRAAHLAGVTKVPVVIRYSDEADRLEVALIENMVREDLNPVEEAKACAALVEDLGLSKEELGRRIGRSRPTISNLIRLLELPDDVLVMLEEGRLSEGHGKAILSVEDHDARRKFGKQAAAEGWSVRQTEEKAKTANGGSKKSRPKASGLSAEEIEAIDEVTAKLETKLDKPVRIKPRGQGLTLEIQLESLDQALDLAKKLK